MTFKFYDGQEVEFITLEGCWGTGKIVGVAWKAGPIIKQDLYMVEVMKYSKDLPSLTYPFKVIPVFESFMSGDGSQIRPDLEIVAPSIRSLCQ